MCICKWRQAKRYTKIYLIFTGGRQDLRFPLGGGSVFCFLFCLFFSCFLHEACILVRLNYVAPRNSRDSKWLNTNTACPLHAPLAERVPSDLCLSKYLFSWLLRPESWGTATSWTWAKPAAPSSQGFRSQWVEPRRAESSTNHYLRLYFLFNKNENF